MPPTVPLAVTVTPLAQINFKVEDFVQGPRWTAFLSFPSRSARRRTPRENVTVARLKHALWPFFIASQHGHAQTNQTPRENVTVARSAYRNPPQERHPRASLAPRCFPRAGAPTDVPDHSCGADANGWRLLSRRSVVLPVRRDPQPCDRRLLHWRCVGCSLRLRFSSGRRCVPAGIISTAERYLLS